MQYTNYALKNNVFGTLSAPISSLATSIQLNTGQGQRFTADMLATLESMEGNKVTKREIVKITNVTGDTLTVIRKFAPCPSSDDANTQGQVSYSFWTDDTISVYISKEHFDKIDSSLNDLYDNGVNKLRTEVVSGLQIKVNPGIVLVGNSYYEFAGDTITLTNNATNYVEIDEDGDLVANTTAWGDKNTKIAKVVTSGWAITSIEDRRLGTVWGKIWGVEIHELTEKNKLSNNDEFVIADSDNIYSSKKIKAKNMWFNKLIEYFELWENVTAGDYQGAVYIGSDGKAYLSDSEDIDKNKCDGIALDSWNTGDMVRVAFEWFINLTDGQYNGDILYINNGLSDGGVQSFPDYVDNNYPPTYNIWDLTILSISAHYSTYAPGRCVLRVDGVEIYWEDHWYNGGSGFDFSYTSPTLLSWQITLALTTAYASQKGSFTNVQIHVYSRDKKGCFNNVVNTAVVGTEMWDKIWFKRQ